MCLLHVTCVSVVRMPSEVLYARVIEGAQNMLRVRVEGVGQVSRLQQHVMHNTGGKCVWRGQVRSFATNLGQTVLLRAIPRAYWGASSSQGYQQTSIFRSRGIISSVFEVLVR